MIETYEDRDAASIAAADIVETAVRRRLSDHDASSLILPGGETPRRCFEELAVRPIPWDRTWITLTDERWVPPDHRDSNERLLWEALLSGPAAAAKFFPLYRGERSIAAAQPALEAGLRKLPLPFACSLVGIGEDGHFASIFPDAPNLDELTDADGQYLCRPVETAASRHPRMTLTLAALSHSDTVVVLVFGEAKRRVLKHAAKSADALPVSRLLWQKRAPVRVVFAS